MPVYYLIVYYTKNVVIGISYLVASTFVRNKHYNSGEVEDYRSWISWRFMLSLWVFPAMVCAHVGLAGWFYNDSLTILCVVIKLGVLFLFGACLFIRYSPIIAEVFWNTSGLQNISFRRCLEDIAAKAGFHIIFGSFILIFLVLVSFGYKIFTGVPSGIPEFIEIYLFKFWIVFVGGDSLWSLICWFIFNYLYTGDLSTISLNDQHVNSVLIFIVMCYLVLLVVSFDMGVVYGSLLFDHGYQCWACPHCVELAPHLYSFMPFSV